MTVISNGTNLINNGALDSGVPTGSLILISEQTASSSATIDFTSGIDSTYDKYVFKFINLHPSNNNVRFQFNMSTDGGSNYNVTKTTTYFRAFHGETGSHGTLEYDTGRDLAQSTSFQDLTAGNGNGSDEDCNGTLTLFNPSSTTFLKHFICRMNTYNEQNISMESNIAGYGNTTSAVDGIRFQMDGGNIDAGTIKMYGVK